MGTIMSGDPMLQSQHTKTFGGEPNSGPGTSDPPVRIEDRRHPRHDGAGAPRPATAPSEEPAPIRRRATDDPATPIPKRNVSEMAGSVADAVSSAFRYLRRATDPRPESEALPDVDAATPELRRRILAVQGETDARPGLLRWLSGPAASWRNKLR